jgi:hypothetical protein
VDCVGKRKTPGNQSPDRDSNQAPPKYKSGGLLLYRLANADDNNKINNKKNEV